jgi:peptidoglycan/LPS O-acetylase OafA/YrhL
LIAAVLISILVYLTIASFGLHGSISFRLGGELNVVRERATMEWTALPSTLLLLYGAVPSTVPWVVPTILMDGSLWTLPYEWWFYILTFLSWRLSNGLRFSTVAPLVAVIGMLLLGRNLLFLWFLMIWLSGYALGFAYLNGAIHSPRFWSVVFGLSVSLLLTIIVLGRGHILHDILNPFLAQSSMACVGALISLGIAAMMRVIKHPIGSFATRTAKFSYTLYIVHYPFLLLAYSLLHPLTHGHSWAVTALAAVVSVALIVVISSQLARVIENRALILRLIHYKFSRPMTAETLERP